MRDIFSDLLADPSSLAPFCPDTGPAPSPSSSSSAATSNEGVRKIDLYGALSRALFDLIGEIGIGHRFDALNDWEGVGGKIFHEYDRMQQMVPGAQGLRFELSVLWPAIDRWFVRIASPQYCSRLRLADWQYGIVKNELTESAYRELEACSFCYGPDGTAEQEADTGSQGRDGGWARQAG